MDNRGDSKRYIEESCIKRKNSYWRNFINRFDAGPLLLVGFLILISSVLLNSSDVTGYAIFGKSLGVIGLDVVLFVLALVIIFFGLRKCR